VILIYAANMFGPMAFAAFVSITKRFDVAFIVSGASTLICLPLLWGLDRDRGPSQDAQR
jgi:hypothetical protein